MSDFTDFLLVMVLGISWAAGFAIANGFWSTLFCVIPFWAWYLTIERWLQVMGWI